MNKTTTTLILFGLLAVGGTARGQSVDWYVIGNGNERVTNGTVILDGTVSQLATPVVTNGTNTIGQGFWHGTYDWTDPHPFTWYVIASGGGEVANASNALNATIGQTPVGDVTNGTNTVGQGFWYGLDYGINAKIVIEPVDGGGAQPTPTLAGTGAQTHAATMQVIPNPVSSTARIDCFVPETSAVRVEIYDGTGVLRGVVFEGEVRTRAVELTLDGSKLPTGTYLLRMTTDREVVTRKVSVVR